MPTTRPAARRLGPFRVGAFDVDPARGLITGPAGETRVEPRVMDVLGVLASRAPQPVPRDELILAVWGHAHVTDGVVTRCISLLRQRFEDDRDNPKYIATLSKRGYQLLQPVTFVNGAATPSVAPAAGSLAVLPFLNLSGNAGDEYLADGLTELLIANLGSVRSLRVISRTSSMTYKRARKPLTEIGAELKVTHVVEGSLLHSGGRLQVVAQLIEVATDTHRWARTYTRELSGLLSLLNEIAISIAHELRAALTPDEASRLAAPKPLPEDALHAYLRGRFLWAQRNGDALRKAADSFAACTRIAPDFAPAYGGWADCHIVLALYGIDKPADAALHARRYSDRALALDPGSGEAHASRGSVHLFFDWDFDAARQSYEQAIALAPSHSVTYLSYGDLEMALGQFESGIALLQQAVRLSPLDLGYGMNVGDFLFFSGRFAEAAAQQARMLEMGPHFVPARLRLAESYAMAGRATDARHEADRALAEAPTQPRVRESHAFVLATIGAKDEARAELHALEDEATRRYVNPWELARAYAAMSDTDAALRWLDAGCEDRAPMMIFSAVYPPFRSLRGHPRFAAALERIGVAGVAA
jgi:TolB-like protein/Tfp pilus assembly protein PilF